MRERETGTETKKKTQKLFSLLRSDHNYPGSEDGSPRMGSSSPGYSSDRSTYESCSLDASPYLSPSNITAPSPFVKSPWTHSSAAVAPLSDEQNPSSLVGSMIREQGHLYSIAAAANGLLYTGSDSKNIRVWKNLQEFSGFKSGSGLVKSIVVSRSGKIFTGHQDGKIRIWKVSPKDPSVYKRIGTLPKLKDFLKSSINPSAYVQVRRHKNAVWLRHFDAVSSLCIDEDAGLLYSGSWDKTVKVWRVSDSKCMESLRAHDDAINAVAVAFGGCLFSGSADGTVKVWKREGELYGKHVMVRTLLRQECAVTALAVSGDHGVLYCGSSDGAVNFWERGRRLVHGGVLRGHKLAVLCLATAGRLLVSGSADRTIGVWRREGAGHVRVSVLMGHTGPVKCLAVEEERDGDRDRDRDRVGTSWVLYSGSLDKSVKVWRVAEGTQGEIENTRNGPQCF